MSDSFVTHIDRCLGCLNCQTACPSGVAYGSLLERARAQIAVNYRRPWLGEKLRKHFYADILPSFGKLARHARLVRLYQRSGLQSLARATGLLKLLGVAELDALSPRIDSEFSFADLGKVFPAEGERRGRVALLIGCVASVAFAELNRATIRVLTRNGIEVHIPEKQSCCGALQLHAGHLDLARDQARRNIDAMLSPEFDAIVTNAAGCGSTLKNYDHLFGENEEEYAAAKAFRSKVRDVTEFLAALGLSAKLKPVAMRVTYQDSCHLLHGQKVREAPRQLLKAIPGVEFVELPYSDICCGSAGIYNVTQTDASLELLAEKMEYAWKTRAQVIATANPGCLLQMRAGVEMHGTGQEVLHVVEVIERAMTATGDR